MDYEIPTDFFVGMILVHIYNPEKGHSLADLNKDLLISQIKYNLEVYGKKFFRSTIAKFKDDKNYTSRKERAEGLARTFFPEVFKDIDSSYSITFIKSEK